MFAARHFCTPMLMAFLTAGSLVACQKSSAEKANAAATKNSAEIKRDAEAARQSLEGLKAPLAEVNGKYAALRPEFDALPPDLPDFGETRGEFYAASIALGTMSSKLPWLSERIDTAVKAGDSAALQEISKEVVRTHDEIRQADKIALQLMHKILPFKQLAVEVADTNKLACENVAAKKEPKKVAPQRSAKATTK